MTIEKLPSGSYRIRHMVNGKRHSLTVPYKPSKKEAYELIQNKINHVVDDSLTFEQAAGEYIASRDNVLSPSTLLAYRAILRNLPKNILSCNLAHVDEYTIQKYLNQYAADHAPKTVNNVGNFILAVIRFFYPKTDISITLPQIPRIEPYTPTVDDVKRIMEASKGTKYYIPLFLACLGLRNSEICALTIFDLKDDRLTINKAYVNSSNGYVLKNTPKTDKSNRIITIPSDLADQIREQGSIFDGYPRQIYKHLQRIQKKLGIPAFGIHRMRHFFASYMHELGYPDALIQSLGGWSTDHVMKSVYRHAMNEDVARKSVNDDFSFL